MAMARSVAAGTAASVEALGWALAAAPMLPRPFPGPGGSAECTASGIFPQPASSASASRGATRRRQREPGRDGAEIGATLGRRRRVTAPGLPKLDQPAVVGVRAAAGARHHLEEV